MTIEDQVLNLISVTQQVATDVAALKNTVQNPVVDLTPVLAALASNQADLDTKLDEVIAQFQATPAPAPAPASA